MTLRPMGLDKARRRRTASRSPSISDADLQLKFDKSRMPDLHDIDPNDIDTTPQGLLPIIAAKKRRRAAVATLFERLAQGRPQQEPTPPPTPEATPLPVLKLLDWLQHTWAKPTICARDIYRHGPSSVRDDRKSALEAAEILEKQRMVRSVKHTGDRKKWQITIGTDLENWIEGLKSQSVGPLEPEGGHKTIEWLERPP